MRLTSNYRPVFVLPLLYAMLDGSLYYFGHGSVILVGYEVDFFSNFFCYANCYYSFFRIHKKDFTPQCLQMQYKNIRNTVDKCLTREYIVLQLITNRRYGVGEIDTDFMLNLERARDLLPKLKAKLDTVADIPEDLDEPVSQEEVDVVPTYTQILSGSEE